MVRSLPCSSSLRLKLTQVAVSVPLRLAPCAFQIPTLVSRLQYTHRSVPHPHMQHRDRVGCQRIGSFCPDIDCICHSRQQVSAERLVIIAHAITERVFPDLSIDRFCNPLRALPCAMGKWWWRSETDHNHTTDCLLLFGDRKNWLPVNLILFDGPFL